LQDFSDQEKTATSCKNYIFII